MLSASSLATGGLTQSYLALHMEKWWEIFPMMKYVAKELKHRWTNAPMKTDTIVTPVKASGLCAYKETTFVLFSTSFGQKLI